MASSRFRAWLRCAFVLLVLPTAGCQVLFPGHPLSEAHEGEVVRLEFVEKPGAVRIPVDDEMVDPQVALDTSGAASAVLGYAVDFAAAGLEKESGRYTASYGATKAVNFYRCATVAGVPAGACRYGGFILERAVDDGSAARFEFRLEEDPSMPGRYRVVLGKVDLQRSRAKVFDASWSRGWWTRVPFLYGFLADVGALWEGGYGDCAVDLNVSVVVEADSMHHDEAGRQIVEKARIAHFEWVLQDVPLAGGERTVDQDGGWLSVPMEVVGNKVGSPLSFTVTVQESDELGELVGKAAEILKKNRDKIVDLASR